MKNYICALVLFISAASNASEVVGKIGITQNTANNSLAVIIRDEAAIEISDFLLKNRHSFEYNTKYKTTIQSAQGIMCERSLKGNRITCYMAMIDSGVYLR